MATTGTATVNFGAFAAASPGAPVGPNGGETRTTVTGQTGILSSSFVEAWIAPVATSDHSVDEHFIENIRVTAGNIVPGVGFDIYAEAQLGGVYGSFNVFWIWN